MRIYPANLLKSPKARTEALSTRRRIDLYSPRLRHATASYLKLRLLELREEGLDRARAAIERRIGVDELLAPPRQRPQR